MADSDTTLRSARVAGIERIDDLLKIMRAIGKGHEPHEIQVEGFPDMRKTVDSLIDCGLVETLGFAPLLQAEHRPGVYFLTDKGHRWLRTFGWWERWKHELSRWQLVWGIIIGVFTSLTASFVQPFVFGLACSIFAALCNLIAVAYLAAVLRGIL